MNILILGPPGTGKGTQAKLLAPRFKLNHISTGEIFREEYRRKTPLGIEAHDKYWGRGNLVPDDLTIKLVSGIKGREGFLFDGFPRTLYQAQYNPFPINMVIHLDSDAKNVIKRLLQRAKTEGRADDTEEVIKQRLRVYEQETKPLLNFYGEKVVHVDGNGTINEVFTNICKKCFGKI